MSAPRIARFFLLLVLIASSGGAVDIERSGGPYVPTPQAVVDAMLDIAKVGPNDFVIDLGSGDGRIVLTAAQRYRARGFGVDIDSELVDSSNAEAQRRGLAERVNFQHQDVMTTRIEDATVVTLYLLPGLMQLLQERFVRELKPGTRIVSHDFPFGDWKPDREVSVDIPEKYGSPGQWKSTVFYWVVPVQVQGVWALSAPGLIDQPLALTLEQRFQYVEGAAPGKGKRVALSDGKIEASRIRFKLPLAAGTYEFRGVVEGDRMRGEAVQRGRSVAWSATRTTKTTAGAVR